MAGWCPSRGGRAQQHLRRPRARMHAKTARQDDPSAGSCHAAETRFRQRRYRLRRPLADPLFQRGLLTSTLSGTVILGGFSHARPAGPQSPNTLGYLLLITSPRPSGKQDDVMGSEPRPGQPSAPHHHQGKRQSHRLAVMPCHVRPLRSEVGSVGSVALCPPPPWPAGNPFAGPCVLARGRGNRRTALHLSPCGLMTEGSVIRPPVKPHPSHHFGCRLCGFGLGYPRRAQRRREEAEGRRGLYSARPTLSLLMAWQDVRRRWNKQGKPS